MLERRSILGGACVTEEVWPGQRVSRASYVVSMLNPRIVSDLELKRFGYEAVALDPPFATFAADGKPILFLNDDRLTYESIARVSQQGRRRDGRLRGDHGARRRVPAAR